MRVAVIGGGPSGLVTLKYLVTAHDFFPGMDPIEAKLFEAQDSIGGTFTYRVYEDAEVRFGFSECSKVVIDNYYRWCLPDSLPLSPTTALQTPQTSSRRKHTVPISSTIATTLDSGLILTSEHLSPISVVAKVAVILSGT